MTVLTSEIVSQITHEIWAALLVGDGPHQLLPGDLPAGEMYATVHISGEWDGTVCLSCSLLAGRHATSAMFGLSDDEVTEADINDAVGELVNVVGGNIKSLVPAPSVLSLPVVTVGSACTIAGHLDLCQEVRFSWMAEPIVVSVWTTPDNQ